MTSRSKGIGAKGPALLAAVFTLLSVAPTRAALIDFESLALDEFVTDQFAAQGVLFGNAVTLVAGISLNEIDFPPTSGANVIGGFEFGPLVASLPLGAAHVSLKLTTGVPAAVRFFDSLDSFLGESLVGPNLGGNTLVAFDSLTPIATVSIGDEMFGSAFFLTVDDFDAVGRAPEPSMLLLMAFGLLPVAVSVARRRV
jgi:hypothetical protein